MKFCLPVVLALLATLLQSTGYATAKEPCPEENCLDSPDKCDQILIDGVCPHSSDTCCSVVKPSYRTQCRHHGGECMDRCSPVVQQPATDCPEKQVCCVLV